MGSVAVFDSSAILAMIFGEGGGDLVIERLRRSLLSSVNLVEVHTKLLANGLSRSLARQQIAKLECEICSFDFEQARLASEMIHQTKPLGLALGDRACLALALQRNATVFTADRAWKNLDVGLAIELIR